MKNIFNRKAVIFLLILFAVLISTYIARGIKNNDYFGEVKVSFIKGIIEEVYYEGRPNLIDGLHIHKSKISGQWYLLASKDEIFLKNGDEVILFIPENYSTYQNLENIPIKFALVNIDK